MKKLLIGLAIFFAVVLGAMFAIPYLFKDEIVEQVKVSANESLTAKLDFSDVDVSLFRNFPKLSVGLKDLEITNGQGPFEGVKLVRCERLDLAVDLWSVIFGNEVVINGIFLKKPDLKVYVLSNGQANYDIAKPDDAPAKTSSSSASTPLKLEAYGISDGKILYDDRGLNMRASLDGLQHTGKGDFGATLYDLVMKTTIEKLSVNYGGIQYLRNARANWNATLGADMANMKYTFKKNDLSVNDLKLMLDGWVQMPEKSEDIRMDLTFGTPVNTFKSLLSIVPGAYTKDFKDVQANGTVQFAGFAKGTYNDKSYPAFKLNMKVGDADFKYPTLPLGVKKINVDATVALPSSRLNDLTVSVPKFSLTVGSNPLEGHFYLKTPETNPTVDTRLNGTLNLGELAKAFPMEGVEELAGILKANMTVKASMSQIDQGKYDEVDMKGSFGMSGFTYRSPGTPVVKINALATNITPQRVEISEFDAKLGKSDLRASGSIDNLLAYFSTSKTMRGNLSFFSNYFDANEWTEPAPSDGSPVPSDVPADESGPAFDRWDFTMDGKINRLKYDTYDISNLSAQGHFTPNKMDISQFGLKIGDNSDLSGSGQILNAWNYLFDNQTVSGTVNLSSSYFDLNQFMTEPEGKASAAAPTAEPAAEAVIPVPENMDMTLNANFGKVKYTNFELSNLTGKVKVQNSIASLEDCTAEVIGGRIALNGDYNTQNLAKPSFNMDMALQNMGFREAFQTFATVKTLAPVAQLIDGKFNTTLSLSGLLGKDMMPDFSTLSAAGFLETTNAVFNNFKPMNVIGDKLNIASLKRLELKGTKNWFEVKDGKVIVKPFSTKVQDIAMQISGSHGITSDMDYQILTKVPKKSLGSAANSGLDLLGKEAAKAGVSIAQGEFVNVRFDLTGTLFNPKVAMKVLGSDGESTLKDQAASTAGAYAHKAKDSLTNMANRELDKARQKAQEAAQKAADSLRTVAEKKMQEAADKAAKEAKDKVGEKAGEVLGEQGKKATEEVKDKLNKWDPFKKKKN
jgi:hypothetical protein